MKGGENKWKKKQEIWREQENIVKIKREEWGKVKKRYAVKRGSIKIYTMS